MPIQFVDQISSLSVFTGVDEETGAPLPTETWSDKLWATKFAEALSLSGLTLSWGACTIYHHGVNYSITAGSHVFTADVDYSTSVVIWLDPTAGDNLTIDIVVLDGAQAGPPAPVVGDDIVRLAWGSIGAGATEMALNVLEHREEF